MAKFRMVHTQFWDDPKVVEEMTPEDRYVFLYLLTNSNTKQIGIYTITRKQMSFDTGYTQEAIQSILERLIKKHKLLKYNSDTREIAIKNWGKFNFIRGGKPMEDCVKSELTSVKDVELIRYVGERVENKRIRDIYESFASTPDESVSENEEVSTNKGFDDTLTIRGQEEEKEEEEEKEQEQQQEKEYKQEEHHGSGGGCGQQNAINFYQKNFGLLSPFITEEILHSVDEYGDELVIEAMKIALTFGKRNWRYTYGVLKRWRDEQVKTVEDVYALEKEFEQRKQQPIMPEMSPNIPGIYVHDPSLGED